jgi:hypothetical protein
MTRMLRIGRIALAFALCALVVAPSALGREGGEVLEPGELYWLGPYFAGLRLTGTSPYPAPSFAYGDCELPEGEGGCSVPAQVQNWTSCSRNPVGLDSLPYEVYLVRGGGLAAAYESTWVDVGTGRQTVTVFANEVEIVGAALREMRPRSHSAPQPLPPPEYPMPVLRELKRVTVAAERFDGIGAIARAIDVRPAEVRVRLRIAELLGPDALADVPPPTMSIATLERLRQLAFRTQFRPARAARQRGESVTALRAKVSRVRGLTGLC